MTRKHFDYAAGLVNGMRTQNERDARISANAYIALFRAFNPLFDVQRFLKACGFGA